MLQFPLPSNNNNMHGRLMYSTQTYIRVCSYNHHGRNSLLVYRSEKYFNQMLLLKIRHILCTIHFLRRPSYFREN